MRSRSKYLWNDNVHLHTLILPGIFIFKWKTIFHIDDSFIVALLHFDLIMALKVTSVQCQELGNINSRIRLVFLGLMAEYNSSCTRRFECELYQVVSGCWHSYTYTDKEIMSFLYEFSLSSYKQGRRDIAWKSNCVSLKLALF